MQKSPSKTVNADQDGQSSGAPLGAHVVNVEAKAPLLPSSHRSSSFSSSLPRSHTNGVGNHDERTALLEQKANSQRYLPQEQSFFNASAEFLATHADFRGEIGSFGKGGDKDLFLLDLGPCTESIEEKLKEIFYLSEEQIVTLFEDLARRKRIAEGVTNHSDSDDERSLRSQPDTITQSAGFQSLDSSQLPKSIPEAKLDVYLWELTEVEEEKHAPEREKRAKSGTSALLGTASEEKEKEKEKSPDEESKGIAGSERYVRKQKTIEIRERVKTEGGTEIHLFKHGNNYRLLLPVLSCLKKPEAQPGSSMALSLLDQGTHYHLYTLPVQPEEQKDEKCCANRQACAKATRKIGFKLVKVAAGVMVFCGIVYEVAFEKFTFIQLTDFFTGRTPKTPDEIPTESFLEFLNIDTAGTRGFSYGISLVLIIGDGLANFLAVTPFDDMHAAFEIVGNHQPLSRKQWQDLQHWVDDTQWSSCPGFFKKLFDKLIFGWGPLALPFRSTLPLIHFMAGDLANYSGVKEFKDLIPSENWREGLGRLGIAAGVAYYLVMYTPLYAKGLRRIRYAFHNPNFSLLDTIKDNPGICAEIVAQFLLVQIVRNLIFVFSFRDGYKNSPFTYDPEVADVLADFVIAATVDAVLFTRFFSVVDKLFSQQDDPELNLAQFKQQFPVLKATGIVGKYSRGVGPWQKFIAFVEGTVCRMVLPSYLIYLFSEKVNEDPHNWGNWLGLGLSAGFGLLGTFLYNNALGRKFYTEAYNINNGLKDALTAVGDHLDYTQVLECHEQADRQVVMLQEYEKVRNQYGAPIDAELKGLIKAAEINLAKFAFYKKRYEALLDFCKKFIQVIDIDLTDSRVNLDDQARYTNNWRKALKLYLEFKEQYKKDGLHWLPNALTNLAAGLTAATRQVTLVHFTVVELTNYLGRDINPDDLYTPALLFALGAGLPVAKNNFAVFEGAVGDNLAWISKWVSETRCCKKESFREEKALIRDFGTDVRNGTAQEDKSGAMDKLTEIKQAFAKKRSPLSDAQVAGRTGFMRSPSVRNPSQAMDDPTRELDDELDAPRPSRCPQMCVIL